MMALHDLYAAVWDKSSGPAWQARHRMSASAYQSTFDTLLQQGYRLRMVSGYAPDGEDLYAALWEQASGPAWQAHHRMNAADYQHTFDQMVAQGYRLITVSGYAVGGQDMYAALWEKDSSVAWQARHRLTAAQYQTTFDQLVAEGYRLTWVDCYTVAGEDLYAAIWQKSAGAAWQARHRMTPAQYQATFDQMLQQGYRPVCVSACNTGGQDLYAALWEKVSGPAWVAHHAMSSGGYQYTFDQLLAQGYRLRFVMGYPGEDPALAVLDFTMQHQLQSEWCWAATSVSVAHYYDAHSSWTQCQMVNAQTGHTTCCQDGSSSDCNQPGYLDDALTRCGHLSSDTGGTTAINEVLDDLASGNPVCIRIGWSGGGGHFIAATGAEDPDIMIVDDPIYGHSVLSYNTLANDYQGSGSWTNWYYTKP